MNRPRIFAKTILAIWIISALSACTPISTDSIENTLRLSDGKATSPGTIANVFGWGYNRASCSIENNDALVFFYAEDQHLYYTRNSNPAVYGRVHNTPQNPDFDIVCDEEEIHITFSDPNQQRMYHATSVWNGVRLDTTEAVLVFDGYRSYSAVAPHLRVFQDSPFIAFMEYGQPGENQDSKAYVSHRMPDNTWFTQEVYHSSAKNTPVLGISLELVNDQLIALVAPNPKGMYQVVYFPGNERWSVAERIPGIEPKGHLEWLTATDTSGKLHMVYRDERQSLAYANYDGTTWHTSSIETVALNAFTLFFDQSGSAYILYNQGRMRKVIDNTVSEAIDLSEQLGMPEALSYLKVPQNVAVTINITWASATQDDHKLFYEQIPFPQDDILYIVDTDITTASYTMPLTGSDTPL